MKELRLAFLTAFLTCTSFAPGARVAFSPEYGELVCRKNSLYTSIFVYRQESIVTLRFGLRRSVAIQTQRDAANPREHLLEYTQMAFCGLLYNPDPNSVLVLGQGGGVIPMDFHHYYPNALIDVVEIDGEIPAIAEAYFGFKTDERMKVFVEDGRIFIKKSLLRSPDRKYDCIVLDAFNGDYIPFHLMTREFLLEVKNILSDDGVVIANVFSTNRLFDAELKTFIEVFGDCQVFMGRRSTNAMLAATKTNKPLTREEAVARAARLQNAHAFKFDLTKVAQQLNPDVKPDPRAKVLTDDRAPVNWLRTQEMNR
jgi:spermidine synthase